MSLAFSLACCGSLGLPDYPPATQTIKPPKKKGRSDRYSLDTVEEEYEEGPEHLITYNAAPSYQLVAERVMAGKQVENLGAPAKSRQGQELFNSRMNARPEFDCSPQRYRDPASLGRSSSTPAIGSKSVPKARLVAAGEAALGKAGATKNFGSTADGLSAISAASKRCEMQLVKLQSMLLSSENSVENPENSAEAVTSPSASPSIPLHPDIRQPSKESVDPFKAKPSESVVGTLMQNRLTQRRATLMPTRKAPVGVSHHVGSIVKMGDGTIAGRNRVSTSVRGSAGDLISQASAGKKGAVKRVKFVDETGAETQEFDPAIGERLRVDDLKQYPPVEAIRMALMLCGTVQEVHHFIDTNGNGSICMSEFESGLHSLQIPWRDITGLRSINHLWKLFDLDRNGTLDITELLGSGGEDVDENHALFRFKLLTTNEQWSDWVDRARKLGPCRRATWVEDDVDRIETNLKKEKQNDYKRSRMKIMMTKDKKHLINPSYVATHLPRNLNEQVVAKQRHHDLDTIDKRAQKITKFLEDAKESRKELAKYVKVIQAVNTKEERELMKKERKKRQTQQMSDAAQLLGIGNRQWGKPMDPNDKINFFNEDALGLTPVEMEVRQLARELGIPIPDAEVIRRCFDQVDQDKSGEIDKREFTCLLRYMFGAVNTDHKISESKINLYWLQVNADGSEGISFDEFLGWYYFVSGLKVPLTGSVNIPQSVLNTLQ